MRLSWEGVDILKHDIRKSNLIIIFAFVSIFVGQLLRVEVESERVDQLIFIINILFTIVIYKANISVGSKISNLLSILAVIFLTLGVMKKSNDKAAKPDGTLVDSLWNGFGIEVLTLLIIIFILVLFLDKIKIPHRFSRSIQLLILIILVIIYALSTLQSKNSIIDFIHSKYILNESLAFTSGHIPYVNFIPQYSILYSVILYPISGILNLHQQIDFALSVFFLVTLIAMYLSIKIVQLSLKLKNYLLSFLLVVPLSLLTPGFGREWIVGSIMSSLSAIPIRIFPVILLFYFYMKSILIKEAKVIKPFTIIAIGLGGGLLMWVSQDFGIAGFVALIATILLTRKYEKYSKIKQIFFLSIGALMGIATYPFILYLLGQRIELGYIAFFSRQFGSGFGSVPISVNGPILFLLPVIFATLYFHLIINKSTDKNYHSVLNNSFVGLFFIVFILCSSPYYINRSITSGQLQIYLLPLSISIGTLFGTLQHILPFKIYKLNFFAAFKTKSCFYPLIIICLFPISALALMPNPKIELNRLSGSNVELNWPPKDLRTTLSNIEVAKEYSKTSGIEVTYFGSFSNYISQNSNIKSTNIYNSPYDFLLSEKSREIGCNYLKTNGGKFLILDQDASEVFQIEMDKRKSPEFCGLYQFSDNLQIEPYFFAERITSK